MRRCNCFPDDDCRLEDLQIYDRATRGPAGATLFLWHFRKAPAVTYCAAIGCLLTIVGLAIEPFLQQSLSFYPRWTEVKMGATATMPYAVTYDYEGIGVTGVSGDISMTHCRFVCYSKSLILTIALSNGTRSRHDLCSSRCHP